MPSTSRLLSIALLSMLTACWRDHDDPGDGDGDDGGPDPAEVAACIARAPAPPAPEGSEASDERVSARLRALDGCTDLAQPLRQDAMREMERSLNVSYRRAIGLACGEEDDWGDGGDDLASPDEDEGASDHSDTNNQVEGVDEADFVKNDDSYLYVATGNALRIIDAWPAPEAHIAAVAAIEGAPLSMFVAEDRAMVFSSLVEWQGSEDDYGYPRPCTYGYSCSFTGNGYPSKITILDIADRAKPVVEREIWFSGSYVNARRIGADVHTVVSDMGRQFEDIQTWPGALDPYEADPSDIRYAFDQVLARNRRIILETPDDLILPSVRDVVHGPDGPREQVYRGGCSSAYATGVGDGSAITTVASLDLASAGDLSLTSIVSRPGALYGSPEALYLAVPHQADGFGWYEGLDGSLQASSVHKLAIGTDPARTEYRGSGVVEGRVLGQFALDEYEGDLRVATTSGQVPDPDVHSTVTVLREADGELAEVGRIDDLAPNEDIRSVRFDGDHGYVVTFKKTDPLFVLDLATPEKPRVLAELKIPGFSTYMHLMDADHLLTIGYDAADQGDFAWFTGVLLQIFDVSDLENPVLAHRERIGTRGSSSEALTNHLAFNYYPTREALALPMTICEGGDENGGFGTEMTFSGLMVYQVTADAGFSLTGEVVHPAGYDVSCGNWWTDASSQVKRSVFMENYVFSISRSRVKVNAMEALATDLVDLSLEN